MKKQLLILLSVGIPMLLTAQDAPVSLNRNLQYFRQTDQRGLNVFETSKEDTVAYQGLKVRIGGDFAMQFQGLSHSNENPGDTLVDLGSNFNLPTANLNLDVQLQDGFRLHLRTWLSSRHHAEAYVKGGYIQLDKLDFISPGLLSGFMDIATIKIGMDEINFGDAHFRRSDNAMTIFNPFVGNYIMDAFTTQPFLEVLIQPSNFLAMVGISNGRLNQSPIKGDDGINFYAKLGYDNQISDDLRVRLTGSFYNSTSAGTRDYLYGGDRAGGRYYNTLESEISGGSDFDPRFNPGFPYLTAIQINPFVKYAGLEFFGVFEFVTDGRDTDGSYTQIGAEALYRFGASENFYVGGRFNSVTGSATDGGATQDIVRFNVGGGWWMTKNVLAKIEYVGQQHDGNGWVGTRFQDGQFDGLVIEAAISF